MEQIYEKLCWIYSTFRSTFVYYAIGKSYPLSDITQLTRGKIPYPARFNEMMDYKQSAIIQDLQMKDVLCTREDWMSRGTNHYTMPEYYDEEGQELFISMEGIPLRDPEIIAKQIITQLKNFPFYLLDPSNTMIGKIVSNAFEGMAPPRRATLSWVHWLQRNEAVLQIHYVSTNARSENV